MPEYLYRYRPAEAVLDRFHELEKQQIYFAPLKELNDPMEGFLDIVWQGDALLWANLFKHYARCLTAAASLLPIFGADLQPDEQFNLIHIVEQNPPEAPVRIHLEKAGAAFPQMRAPQALARSLSERKRAVRRNELLFLLRILHPIALGVAGRAMRGRGRPSWLPKIPLGATRHAGDQVIKLLHHPEMPPALAEGVFALNEFAAMQFQLLHGISPSAEANPPAEFIVRDFPSLYVESLSKLLYPEHNIASFVEDPTNAAMWGGYANGHRGLCLKFRTGGRPDRPALDLYRTTSWGGSQAAGITERKSFVAHPFKPVRYAAEHPKVDFFTSLGVLPMKLLAGWHSDGKGNVSPAARRMSIDEEGWRDAYWRTFDTCANSKTLDWSHEAEHRLVLTSNLQTFDTVDSRQLSYRFSDLVGIVFGARTSVAHKMQVLKIVKEKCAAEQRATFEFHQAIYDPMQAAMRLVPLDLLKTN